jgi:transcriptional regulator with XRE-family HTH domain
MGDRIAWARERAGLNKNQFARELGTSWQHVDHWEKGRTEPSLASMRRIAEVLGVSIDFLLGVRADPALPSPSGLERFLAQLAPDDLSEDEAQWLRKAPVDEREASAEDYRALLAGLRRIASRPAKSGRRRKVDPSSVETAIRRRKGGGA